jgi:quercetin dioxygenase-like cupin family protein
MKEVIKVWGCEVWLVNEPEYCAKILKIDKGAFSSFHRHLRKKETFIVKDGEVNLEYDLEGNFVRLKPGESWTIEPGTYHRFRGIWNSEILEVSTHHDDVDVQRLTESGRSPAVPPPVPPGVDSSR